MRQLVGILAVLAALGPADARAPSIDETIVHISCTSPGRSPLIGSGVLISADGMVLTVRHVVMGDAATLPPGTVCTGAIGNANRPRSTLIAQAVSLRYDAMVLKFPQDNLPFQRFCRLEPRLQRSQIVATGFPLDSTTGVPSSRVGVLSTAQPDLEGVIDTDSTTTVGMSGGMVTLAGNGNLIGIVSGGQTDALGMPSAYRVIAAQMLEPEFRSFGLTEDAEGCKPHDRLTPVMGRTASGSWRASDPPLPLGLREGEGFCFLVSVWGSMDHQSDMVQIEVQDGEFVLSGRNAGSGSHGALARCARF
jgi:hypothetical protein